jgi:hypothetical protein
MSEAERPSRPASRRSRRRARYQRLAVLVAFVSWLLVLHYNRRITGARNDAKRLVDQMREKGIDYDIIMGTNVAT